MRTDLKITYEQYAALPETNRKQELLDGDLIVSPSPTPRHQKIVLRLVQALGLYLEAHPLGELFVSPLDVVLSDVDVVQPDIVFVSSGQKSILTKQNIRGAPDLCIEVLSEGSTKYDLGIKRVLYARHGVIEYWAVDPSANTIDVYRLQENAATPVQRFGVAAPLHSALLSGLELSLKKIFAE